MNDRGSMSGRSPLIQQREAKQIIKAARQAGARKIEFHIGAVPVIIHLDTPNDDKPAEANEWLEGDDTH
jgi:hypothetical protein